MRLPGSLFEAGSVLLRELCAKTGPAVKIRNGEPVFASGEQISPWFSFLQPALEL